MRRSVAALLILALSSLTASAQAPPARRPFARPGTPKRAERVRTFDVKHIKAELTLDVKKKEIRGTVTHTIAPLHPGFNQVTLDCGPDLKVSRVAVGPSALAFTHDGDKLIYQADRTYGPADTFDLAITYSGSPKEGLHFVRPDPDHPDRAACAWTVGEPEDARNWIPCFDQPSERSTAEMIVTVDQPLTVVSNGRLDWSRQNADGTATFAWKMDDPLPTYLISIVAAEFAVYRDKLGALPVDYYVLKEVDEATARRTMGKTPRMIEFFNQAIGTPYAYVKYATVCVPEFGGGMEHTSATTMTDSILLDPVEALERDSDSIVAHELAHQWFGDLLTCRDWSNLWLNEGFASYFDPLYTEHEEGDDAFRLAMAADLADYLRSDRQYRRPIVEARYDDPWRMFDGVTYAKGACVLHALRGLVGDDAWWGGIKLYVAANKDRTVETADFRKAMETASNRDLGWFFDQWVFHGGHPELTARWRYEDDDRTVRLKVDQVQAVDATTPMFRLPTTVEVDDGSGAKSTPIVVDGRSQEFIIPSPVRPKMVRIDPKGWLPKTLNFEKSMNEWIYQLEHAGDVLGRVEAAKALVERHKDDKSAGEALAKAWPLEKDPIARAEIVRVVGTAGEPSRAALLAASQDAEPRVRVAAIKGLAALKSTSPLEALMRATWANPAEPYGARREALKFLAGAKVKDVDELIASALKDPSGRRVLAREALQVVIDGGGQKAREAAVLYSHAGQPSTLRAVAAQGLGRQARDDPEAEKLLLALVDDPQPNVRMSALFALASAEIPSAQARLEQQLPRVQGMARAMIEARVEELKSRQAGPPAVAGPDPKEAGDLERQAADLELQAKELRNRAEALKLRAERARLAAPGPKPGN